MKQVLWLAALVVLAGCGASEPPTARGGVALDRVWSGTL